MTGVRKEYMSRRLGFPVWGNILTSLDELLQTLQDITDDDDLIVAVVSGMSDRGGFRVMSGSDGDLKA
jgi:hypothetical protein